MEVSASHQPMNNIPQIRLTPLALRPYSLETFQCSLKGILVFIAPCLLQEKVLSTE